MKKKPRKLNAFAIRIRELREAIHMQKKQLARGAGISDSYVTRIEKGDIIPLDAVVMRMARMLNTNEAELVMLARREKAPAELRDIYRPEEIVDFLNGLHAANTGERAGNMVPVLNLAACGEWMEANDKDMPPGEADYYHPMATRDLNAFIVKAKGDSMSGGRIEEGDLLLIEPNRQVENGDIVLARLDGQVTIKKFHRQGKNVILQPMNEKYPPIVLGPEAEDLRVYRVGRIVITL
ncbi:MAG: LexA repressor [Myxococcota bacterium]|nr:LexA repressor [Myxococcota bacterium]